MVLSLGRTPLANALLTAEQLDQPEERYPLDLAFCRECSLVQILETVPPETLFRDYFYFSSFSDTVLRHAEQIACRMIQVRKLGDESLVVEVASNDGYLLQYYRQRGIPVLGIEPAENVARKAESDRGIRTLCEFFSRELAQELRGRGERADVLHANNVLAHVADLNGVVAGMGQLLKDDGVAVIEVPYVKEMLDRCEFDTIYHEHLCYFSLTALDRLFSRHGLVIEGVERLPIHGGSLRIFAAPEGSAVRSPAVTALLEEEAGWGVDQPESYLGFGRRVEKVKADLNQLLRSLVAQGKRLAAYGAAAKGATLLNYCGIGRDLLEFVVDRSTYKQGRYMPGVRLPICPPSKLLESMPDHALLLTWNFADEILEQQAEYQRRGGRFIIPIPEPHVVEP
jgi:SAM-dependent methyltransferase